MGISRDKTYPFIFYFLSYWDDLHVLKSIDRSDADPTQWSTWPWCDCFPFYSKILLLGTWSLWSICVCWGSSIRWCLGSSYFIISNIKSFLNLLYLDVLLLLLGLLVEIYVDSAASYSLLQGLHFFAVIFHYSSVIISFKRYHLLMKGIKTLILGVEGRHFFN